MSLPTWEIRQGDVLERLREMPDESVHCVVTSPPFFGLRDYGCEGQIGLESTPSEYVAKMVEVFREVRRVLRTDGVCFLNLGDSYAGSWGAQSRPDGKPGPLVEGGDMMSARQIEAHPRGTHTDSLKNTPGLKPKDMVGIPWRVAFALQADGWVLRQEIIWGKPNPMPESVRDRCTKAHEQIFMFAKARWSGPPPGRFAHISNEDARWLALLLDTEGNIAVKRSRRESSGNLWYGAQIAFANTDRPLMESAQRIVGKGTIHERAGKNAPVFYYQLSNQAARDFLYQIYPHIIVKRRRARIAMHLQGILATKGKKRPGGFRDQSHSSAVLESLWTRNKECNQFGDPDLTDIPEPTYGRWATCERYFYDADAIREPHIYGGERKSDGAWSQDAAGRPGPDGSQHLYGHPNGRNRRTVWTITTKPYKAAHFATFPPELPEICIKAGTSEKGCCATIITKLQIREDLTSEQKERVDKWLNTRR